METDTYSAKTRLSRLLDQVERGEEVIITRRGKRIARLVRFEEIPPPRRPLVTGMLRDKFPPLPADLGEGDDWQELMHIMHEGEPPRP